MAFPVLFSPRELPYATRRTAITAVQRTRQYMYACPPPSMLSTNLAQEHPLTKYRSAVEQERWSQVKRTVNQHENKCADATDVGILTAIWATFRGGAAWA